MKSLYMPICMIVEALVFEVREFNRKEEEEETEEHGNSVKIRKYGSTFYIGIAMVILPYIGPWEN